MNMILVVIKIFLDRIEKGDRVKYPWIKRYMMM